ncbi:NUDIX hydrolase [Paenibacillus taichungensis]|uniref:NUDIX hydrolase n=1 Tax=Paenibacillus taichungensis TaxID=484184 RepID=UPI0039A1E952
MDQEYIQYMRSFVGNAKVIMVVSGAVVFDETGRVLLQKRSDNGFWGFPGGFMEIGETVQETAQREVYEETGLTLNSIELFSIYSGPEYEVVYSNGDEVALVQVMFKSNDFCGTIKESEESIETRFFDIHSIPDHFLPTHKQIIEDLRNKEDVFAKLEN